MAVDIRTIGNQFFISGSNAMYNNVILGNYAGITIGYNRTVANNPIPRAEGVYMFDMGGGVQVITLECWIKTATVEATTNYIIQLPLLLIPGPATLVHDGTSYPNTYFQQIAMEVEENVARKFTLTFTRSAL